METLNLSNLFASRLRLAVFVTTAIFLSCLLYVEYSTGILKFEFVTRAYLQHAPQTNITAPALQTNITAPIHVHNSTTKPFCGYLVRDYWDGRLGSQMFVYASFYGVAKTVGAQSGKTALVRVDRIPSSLDYIFNLSLPQKVLSDQLVRERNFVKYPESTCCKYFMGNLNNLSCDGTNAYVTGYRNVYKYFSTVFDEIRQEFVFKQHIREACDKNFADILHRNGIAEPDKCLTVGVHLRRGDFANPSSYNYGHNPAKEEYLRRAIAYYELMLLAPNRSQGGQDGKDSNHTEKCLAFLIFGNDYQWNLNASSTVQSLYPNVSRLIVVDHAQSAAVDMCVMTLCNHSIISTGTYSWWAGFLTGGHVTYQKEYARWNSAHFSEYEVDDYFPPSWVPL